MRATHYTLLFNGTNTLGQWDKRLYGLVTNQNSGHFRSHQNFSSKFLLPVSSSSKTENWSTVTGIFFNVFKQIFGLRNSYRKNVPQYSETCALAFLVTTWWNLNHVPSIQNMCPTVPNHALTNLIMCPAAFTNDKHVPQHSNHDLMYIY